MSIQTKTYILKKSTTITPGILNEYLSNFWTDVFTPLHSENNNIHLLLLCKIKYEDSALDFRTIANLRKVNFTEKLVFSYYLVERLGLLTDTYKVNSFTQIVFTYLVKDGIADDKRLLLNQPVYEVTNHVFNNMVLPLTMDVTKYGQIKATEINKRIHKICYKK